MKPWDKKISNHQRGTAIDHRNSGLIRRPNKHASTAMVDSASLHPTSEPKHMSPRPIPSIFPVIGA